VSCDCSSGTLTIIEINKRDTAGQERFRTLIPSYIRDSSVAAIVFDVTSIFFKKEPKTFEALNGWIEDVKLQRGDEALIVIIGNKIDLVEARQVSKEQATSKADELNVLYVEVSALSGDNIKDLFEKIAQRLPNGDQS